MHFANKKTALKCIARYPNDHWFDVIEVQEGYT